MRFREWFAALAFLGIVMVMMMPSAFAQTAPECCTVEQLAVIGITPEQVLSSFQWGFGTVIFFWGLGIGIGAAVEVIRKV